MASEEKKQGRKQAAPAAPKFVIRADEPGAVRAVMAALKEMPYTPAQAEMIIREFDLFEAEARRAVARS